MPTGTVVRFDRRRGYGFVAPDDGGEDVFVHQNNINMDGFRYLMVGEKVNYELEVGEKGMKAVGVALTEPRPPQADGGHDGHDGHDDRDMGYPQEQAQSRTRPMDHAPRQPRFEAAGAGMGAGDRPRGGDLGTSLDKLRRKQERMISLLVEKGLLTPGEIDALEGEAQASSTI
mgnify:CR=1 FL=1